MKKVRFLLMLFIFCIIFSCNSDETPGTTTPVDNENPEQPEVTAGFTASINELPFIATTLSAKKTNGYLRISGIDAAGKSIVIVVDATPGSHSNAIMYYSQSVGKRFDNVSTDNTLQKNGTVTIIIDDENKVSGNFNFSAIRPLDYNPVPPPDIISNGAFSNIQISEEPNTTMISGNFKGDNYETSQVSARYFGDEILLTTVDPSNNSDEFRIYLPATEQGDYSNIRVEYKTIGIDQNRNAQDTIKIGSVTITSFNAQNNTISGTFKFKIFKRPQPGYYNYTFTNGTFTNVPILNGPNTNTEPIGMPEGYIKFRSDGIWRIFQFDQKNITIDRVVFKAKNGNSICDIELPLDANLGSYSMQNPFIKIRFDDININFKIREYNDHHSLSLPEDFHITSIENGWISGTFRYYGEREMSNSFNNIIEITEGEFHLPFVP
ncbi:MAG: hypothetical protein EOO20_13675 [Chryseobacterium sp.]|nr:MAG: hypothetical protein EOO20_13675 [Chryseobacterium sp.]